MSQLSLLSTISKLSMFPSLPSLPLAKKNQLIQLLELFPDQKWRWDGVSSNPNITMEWITEHPENPWCLLSLSSNPSLTMDFFLDFLLTRIELNAAYGLSTWCWKYLSKNPGLKIAEIMMLMQLDKPEKYKWDWKFISRRGDVTMEMMFPTNRGNNIDADKMIEWDYKEASINPNLTSQIVLRYPELWDWGAIVVNQAVEPTREIINHPQYKLKERDFVLSRHPLLSFPLVLEYFNLDKCADGTDATYFKSDDCWKSLSRNIAITIETIIAHPKLPWNWTSVCMNRNLTVAHILGGLLDGKLIDTKQLSSHPNLTVEFILSEKEKYCDWTILSINPNLTAQLVIDNIVDYGITNTNIIGNPWNFDYLSFNSFRFVPKSLAAKEFKYHERADPTIWRSLLLVDSNGIINSDSNTISFSRSSLPTALAELTLRYFSPFY